MLHITAWHDRMDATVYLIEEESFTIDVRESKGWTPLMIVRYAAGFEYRQFDL